MSDLGIKQKGNVIVIFFPDVRLADESRIEAIGRQFISLGEDYPKCHVLLNFENIKFMSSGMIGKILQLSKLCAKRGRKMHVCKLCKEIQSLFEMMKLDKIIQIHSNEQEGIDRLQRERKWFLGRKK